MKEVSLPTGGRAWVRTRLSHERSSCYLAVISGLSVLVGRAKQLSEKAAAGEISETSSEDISAITRHVAQAKSDIVELCCHRWEGVRDPDNPDVELVFPADVGKLDNADFEALFDGCLAGVTEGRADPKGSPAP